MHANSSTNALEQKMINPKIVYLVGSDEHCFVVDRVYLDIEEAKQYCDSRQNSKYEWSVVQHTVGMDWAYAKYIHTIPRKK